MYTIQDIINGQSALAGFIIGYTFCAIPHYILQISIIIEERRAKKNLRRNENDRTGSTNTDK